MRHIKLNKRTFCGLTEETRVDSERNSQQKDERRLRLPLYPEEEEEKKDDDARHASGGGKNGGLIAVRKNDVTQAE